MNDFQLGLLITGLVLALILMVYITYLLIVYFSISARINIRYNKHPLLKYFEAKDFDDLEAEAISFKTKNKKTIRGFIYRSSKVKNYDKVIVFFHGIGGGHLAYTKEINRLVKDNEMAVIAYDNYGSDLSDGKNIKDLSWALVDADYFLRSIKDDARFTNSELILIGHSWGGYVAGNILSINNDSRVKRVIVLNGLPNIADLSTRYTKGKWFSKRLFKLISLVKLGRYANHSTLETLKKITVSTLVVHGAQDPVVPLKYVQPIFDYVPKVKHIRPLIFASHCHFVYLSLLAEEELMLMQRELKRLELSQNKEQLVAYTKSIDYEMIGQQNDELFNAINQFIIRG